MSNKKVKKMRVGRMPKRVVIFLLQMIVATLACNPSQAIAGVNATPIPAQAIKCQQDLNCPADNFCRFGVCALCISCESHKRLPKKGNECAYYSSECGECEDGYVMTDRHNQYCEKDKSLKVIGYRNNTATQKTAEEPDTFTPYNAVIISGIIGILFVSVVCIICALKRDKIKSLFTRVPIPNEDVELTEPLHSRNNKRESCDSKQVIPSAPPSEEYLSPPPYHEVAMSEIRNLVPENFDIVNERMPSVRTLQVRAIPFQEGNAAGSWANPSEGTETQEAQVDESINVGQPPTSQTGDQPNPCEPPVVVLPPLEEEQGMEEMDAEDVAVGLEVEGHEEEEVQEGDNSHEIQFFLDLGFVLGISTAPVGFDPSDTVMDLSSLTNNSHNSSRSELSTTDSGTGTGPEDESLNDPIQQFHTVPGSEMPGSHTNIDDVEDEHLYDPEELELEIDED